MTSSRWSCLAPRARPTGTDLDADTCSEGGRRKNPGILLVSPASSAGKLRFDVLDAKLPAERFSMPSGKCLHDGRCRCRWCWSCASAAAQTPPAAGGDLSGVVKSGGMPLPGVTVSAANSLTGHKVVTSTGDDGSYALHLTANGRYVVRAEMAAFAAATHEVVINAENRTRACGPGTGASLPRAQQAAEKQQQRQAAAAPTAASRAWRSCSRNSALAPETAASMAATRAACQPAGARHVGGIGDGIRFHHRQHRQFRMVRPEQR